MALAALHVTWERENPGQEMMQMWRVQRRVGEQMFQYGRFKDRAEAETAREQIPGRMPSLARQEASTTSRWHAEFNARVVFNSRRIPVCCEKRQTKPYRVHMTAKEISELADAARCCAVSGGTPSPDVRAT